MLQKLRVKNVVLITETEVEFSKGLNVLSGETGAGKSIVVDCLMLLFGYRYDKTLLRYGAEDGYAEGVFSLNEKSMKILEEMGFVGEEIAIIKRRFNAEGKNDIKINGQTATAAMLRRFMSSLIDIYVQHDFLRLNNNAAQLALLDYYDRHRQAKIITELEHKCTKYEEIIKQIKDLGEASERDKEIDYLKYQISEIKNSGVFINEEEEIIKKRRRALNIEKIVASLSELVETIDNACLSKGAAAILKVDNLDPDFSTFHQRIMAVGIELDDLSSSVRQKLNDLKVENIDIDEIEKRLAFLRVLARKYGDFEKMTEYCIQAEARLEKLENCGQLFEELTNAKSKLLKEIYDLSVELSQKRRTAALEFCEKIEKELSELGMENSKFTIVFADLPDYDNIEKHISKNGMDNIEFHLSPNAGQPLLPLTKIISGGEMSRFMLALKVVTGDSDMIPTLIFDEIDAGISGLVGREVAKKLARISAQCQVLCVTHLPQIAAMADNHLCVKKSLVQNETVTNIDKLDKEGMVKEISRLFGGMGISETSDKSATEIKEWCDNYKKSIK